MDEPDLVYDPDTHQISSAATGANALDVSLKVLEESLDSGAALAQFEVTETWIFPPSIGQ